MGILNLTPDSFYDGGRNLTKKNILNSIKSLKKADIIDIGAESTRPFSNPVNSSEELRRLDVLRDIDFSGSLLSIDSYKPDVIKYCLKNGYSMINDISGGGKNNINLCISADFNVPIVIMHMKGNPTNMQIKPTYKNVIDEIKFFFERKIKFIEKEGINKKNIILDPGIGFGKSFIHNFEIISKFSEFKKYGYKTLLGISRKSFLSNSSPTSRLYSSIGVSSVAIMNGVDILRVHDIKETLMMTKVIDKIKYLN